MIQEAGVSVRSQGRGGVKRARSAKGRKRVTMNGRRDRRSAHLPVFITSKKKGVLRPRFDDIYAQRRAEGDELYTRFGSS